MSEFSESLSWPEALELLAHDMGHHPTHMHMRGGINPDGTEITWLGSVYVLGCCNMVEHPSGAHVQTHPDPHMDAILSLN